MQLVILVVGKLAELFRRCKMLLGKVHLPLQGTSHSGEGRSAAQHCWVSFTQVKLWLQFLAKKVQVGAEHSAMAGALCVCTLLNIQQRELHYCFFLDWLSVTNVFASSEGDSRVLLRPGFSCTLPLGLPNLCEKFMKLISSWKCNFGNCQWTLFLFSLTDISALTKGFGNHRQLCIRLSE